MYKHITTNPDINFNDEYDEYDCSEVSKQCPSSCISLIVCINYYFIIIYPFIIVTFSFIAIFVSIVSIIGGLNFAIRTLSYGSQYNLYTGCPLVGECNVRLICHNNAFNSCFINAILLIAYSIILCVPLIYGCFYLWESYIEHEKSINEYESLNDD